MKFTGKRDFGSTIFYYSGSGNSYNVATSIADVDDAVLDMTMAEEKAYEDDTIGFVFPVFCSELPASVKRFVRNAKFTAEYVFAVATCGASVGKALTQLAAILKEKGVTLAYSAKLVMPDSCIIFATPHDKVEKYLISANAALKEIVSDIECRKKTPVISDATKYLSAISWLGMKKFFGGDKKKVSEACIGCGTCRRLCPNGNINIVEGKAEIGKNCEYCFACIQWCPKSAISFGRIKPTEHTKYTNPGVRASDLFKR